MLRYQYNFIVKVLAQVAYNSVKVTKQRTWYIHLCNSMSVVGIMQC